MIAEAQLALFVGAAFLGGVGFGVIFKWSRQAVLHTYLDETVACARGHQHPLSSVPEDESCPTCQNLEVED